jgi:GH15 family glucan-1,4-alpha-glucosidase
LLVFAAWGGYMLITARNVEYEYILTNTELDIDKITAKRARKRVITINFKEIEVCAKTDNPNFKNVLDNTSKITRTEYLNGDMKSENLYFVDFSKESENIRVFFEPNERILNEIKKINPRCVNI